MNYVPLSLAFYQAYLKIVSYLFCSAPTDTYGQAASNLAFGSNLTQTIQQIMDMGGGNWDRETVTRALRAAYNNPERAVDYLYSVCLCWSRLMFCVQFYGFK